MIYLNINVIVLSIVSIHYLNEFETKLYTVLAKQRGDKEKARGRDGGKSPSIMLAVQLITCSNQITLTQAYLLHPMFVFALLLILSLHLWQQPSSSRRCDVRLLLIFYRNSVVNVSRWDNCRSTFLMNGAGVQTSDLQNFVKNVYVFTNESSFTVPSQDSPLGVQCWFFLF